MSRIAVIGGGASGLTAAIAAAENGACDVVIFEGSARVGRKILATGNGRCNMTNINADISNYHGADPSFITAVQKRFWVTETLDFFQRLGIVPRTEDGGRVYPYSSQASSVLDVLRFRIEALKVRTVCSFEVSEIYKKNGRFIIKSYDGRSETADKVIVATGGKAAPDLGSKGAGYDILRSFGHTVTRLSPSLVQIKTDTSLVRALKGIKLNATVKMGGYSEYGEVLFTEYGLSGPAIFSITANYSGQRQISLDIMSEYSQDMILAMIYERIANRPDLPLEDFFTGMFNKRVGQAVFKIASVAPLSRKSVTLGEKEIFALCGVIKEMKFDILGTMSWNNAQVTKGGAVVREFDPLTLESKKTDGLYAAGEVLDIDGDCGGYNLQWAWSSGYTAGLSAARAAREGLMIT